MLKNWNILAWWRRAIVSMLECTAFQVEILCSNRRLKEISVSYVFLGAWSSCRLVCWCLRIIGSFLQLEKLLTSSLVTFVVVDTGPVEKSYIVIGVSWSMCRPMATNVRKKRFFFFPGASYPYTKWLSHHSHFYVDYF